MVNAAVCQLIFVPNGYGNLKKRPVWSIDRGSVRDVSVSPRTWQPYNGGLRRRLKIDCQPGNAEFFGVNKVDRVTSDLRSHLALPDGAAYRL
jgi:hypothetical protein